MFMALDFYIRHKLTQDALEDLMRMLNVLTVGKTFPENFMTFANAFPANYSTERVYFCANCQFGYDFILRFQKDSNDFLFIQLRKTSATENRMSCGKLWIN